MSRLCRGRPESQSPHARGVHTETTPARCKFGLPVQARRHERHNLSQMPGAPLRHPGDRLDMPSSAPIDPRRGGRTARFAPCRRDAPIAEPARSDQGEPIAAPAHQALRVRPMAARRATRALQAPAPQTPRQPDAEPHRPCAQRPLDNPLARQDPSKTWTRQPRWYGVHGNQAAKHRRRQGAVRRPAELQPRPGAKPWPAAYRHAAPNRPPAHQHRTARLPALAL